MPEVLFTGPGYKDLGSLPAELQERVKAKL